MNFVRGLLSIGIIIGCLIEWYSIDIGFTYLYLSGLHFTPVSILLFGSVITAGYAFYNAIEKSRKNSWIYLTNSIYGIGVCLYIYLTIEGNIEFYESLFDIVVSNLLSVYIELGFFITALSSFLLFLTSLVRSDDSENEFDKANKSLKTIRDKREDLSPELKEWMEANPNRSINDFYSGEN